MSEGYSWIGPTRDFWPFAAYVGALAGAPFGLALGLYISLTRAGAGVSAIVGGIVGVIGVLVLLSNIWWGAGVSFNTFTRSTTDVVSHNLGIDWAIAKCDC